MAITNDQEEQQTPRNVPPAPRLDPWLIFLHGRRGQNQTFFSISENRYHVKNIPEMRRKDICTCSDGWLVLIDDKEDENDCFLLKPISMDKIQLPSLKPNFTFVCCVLSSSPNDSNCTVLFMNEPKDGYLPIISYRLGIDDDWYEHKLDLKELKNSYIQDLTCCAGKIYALANCFTVVTIDIDSTPMVIKKVEGAQELPCPLSPEVDSSKIKLVESCGELFGVRMNFFPYEECEVRGIEVYKLDINHNIWARVKNLGDRTFFIGRSYCVSYSTNETESDQGSSTPHGEDAHCSNQAKKENARVMSNTIYFTLPEDRSLYAYKLDDHAIVTTLPCPNVVSHWSQPEWILPLSLD